MGTSDTHPDQTTAGELVPLAAALRHRARYLAVRWWLNNDLTVDQEVFARHTIGPNPVGPRDITLWARRPRARWDPGHNVVGKIEYRICDRCRQAMVANIHTTPGWTRRGYATWMVDRARRIAPDYKWITNTQISSGRAFWEFVKAREPGQYQRNRPCPHILTSWRYPGTRHWRDAMPT